VDDDPSGPMARGVGGPHRVGQAPLVAKDAEQPTRHAATEDGVHHPDRHVVGVTDRRSEEAEEDLSLLDGSRLLVPRPHRPDGRSRERRGGLPTREGAEQPRRFLQDLPRGDLSRHAQNRPRRRVASRQPLDEIGPGEPGDASRLAAGRERVAVRPVEGAGQDAAGHVEGLVLQAADLGEEHVALALHRLRGQARLRQDLVDEPQELRPVPREALRRDLGVLLVAPALDGPTRVLGDAGDVERRAPSGPLEDRPAEEGCHPAGGRVLRHRAARRKERHGDDRGRRVLPHDHPQAVLQPTDLRLPAVDERQDRGRHARRLRATAHAMSSGGGGGVDAGPRVASVKRSGTR